MGRWTWCDLQVRPAQTHGKPKHGSSRKRALRFGNSTCWYRSCHLHCCRVRQPHHCSHPLPLSIGNLLCYLWGLLCGRAAPILSCTRSAKPHFTAISSLPPFYALLFHFPHFHAPLPQNRETSLTQPVTVTTNYAISSFSFPPSFCRLILPARPSIWVLCNLFIILLIRLSIFIQILWKGWQGCVFPSELKLAASERINQSILNTERNG